MFTSLKRNPAVSTLVPCCARIARRFVPVQVGWKTTDPRAVRPGDRLSETRRCETLISANDPDEVKCVVLDGVDAFFARTDADDAVDVGHPDLAVTDLAGGC